MTETNRSNDNIFAKATELFVINNMVQPMKQFGRIQDYQYIESKEEQLLGTDIMMRQRDVTWNVDVKTFSVNYAQNVDLSKFPTFALELDFINRAGNLNIGWFLNDDLNTTHYLFLYPRLNASKADGDKITEKNVTEDDIQSAEAYLVSKKRLKQFFYISRGLTDEIMHDHAVSVRQNAKNEDCAIYHDADISKFRYSPSLAEKPTNILVYKNELKFLSNGVFNIVPQHCKQTSVFDKERYLQECSRFSRIA